MCGPGPREKEGNPNPHPAPRPPSCVELEYRSQKREISLCSSILIILRQLRNFRFIRKGPEYLKEWENKPREGFHRRRYPREFPPRCRGKPVYEEPSKVGNARVNLLPPCSAPHSSRLAGAAAVLSVTLLPCEEGLRATAV